MNPLDFFVITCNLIQHHYQQEKGLHWCRDIYKILDGGLFRSDLNEMFQQLLDCLSWIWYGYSHFPQDEFQNLGSYLNDVISKKVDFLSLIPNANLDTFRSSVGSAGNLKCQYLMEGEFLEIRLLIYHWLLMDAIIVIASLLPQSNADPAYSLIRLWACL